MSVIILQEPTTPNVTDTNLVYTLSSSNASNAQFRYVTDIYESGSGNYLTTIKTYPNTFGNGILDVARELDDQLDYDLNWKTSGSAAPVNSVKTFDLRFGEEYAPSYSGSITQYTGSASNYLQVFPGTVYKNEGSYNFNTDTLPNNFLLSNSPNNTHPRTTPYVVDENNLFCGLSDYHTITVERTGSYAVLILDTNNSILDSEVFTTTQPFSTLGIGPQNLIDFGGDPATAIQDPTAERIVVFEQITPGGGNTVYDLSLPTASDYPCGEYTRFAFINQYGFWDYYNVYNPLRSNNQVDRSIYERSFVRYEDSIGSYNASNRGNTQYKTDYDKRFIITTEYINKETSQWLTEMFDSPEVFIQQNGDFVPINIINANITWNMNQSRQKLFQYDIEFKYANQPQTR